MGRLPWTFDLAHIFDWDGVLPEDEHDETAADGGGGNGSVVQPSQKRIVLDGVRRCKLTSG